MLCQPKFVTKLQSISRYSAIAVTAIGAIVLLGWLFNIATLKTVLPNLVTMKANTALGFVLSGISLWLWHQYSITKKHQHQRTAQILAIVVLSLGLLTLCQYIFKINLGIDQFLFKESVTAVATSYPGRMAPNTALNFLLVGSSLLLLSSPRRQIIVSQGLTITAFLIAFLGFLGYLYGNAYFYQYGPKFTAMAVHTSVAFIILSLGMILTFPRQGLMAAVTMDNAGGLMARRLVLTAIFIPPVVCGLILVGHRHQIYTAEMGISLLGILHVIIFSGLIWNNARYLGRVDRQRHQAEWALQQANQELEQRVKERTQELEEVIFHHQEAKEALQKREAELWQKNGKLQETLRELRSTQTQLVQSEKMSSLGQLVAGVAHEINNPVNFIHGNLVHAQTYTTDLLSLVQIYRELFPNTPPELAEEMERIDIDFLEEDLPKLLNSMRVGTDRIRGIVNALRNFSRMDEAAIKEVNIHEGLESTLLILHNRLKAKPEHPSIEIVKDYSGDLSLVECYPGQLNQVFMNLLANAIDALDEYNAERSPEEIKANPSKIFLTTHCYHDWVRISIADNGKGIPEKTRSQLFDPFFTTKPIGKGTGLGLAISYQIVTEKHGGTLTCHTHPSGGAEFIIEIPCRQQLRQSA